MGLFSGLFGGGTTDDPAARQAAEARLEAWANALRNDELPAAVVERLRDAAHGKTPWMSTMTAAELLIAKTHGVMPVATVTGTCWYQYGRSWTEGHAEGWAKALARIGEEALAAKANAVVDVKLRTSRGGASSSMDFTLVGTAVRVQGLPPSTNPIIATTPALEFVRLLEMGIVPSGLAVGACYNWLTDYGRNYSGVFGYNQPLQTLGNFWESIRREAHADLRQSARYQGTGVLAHTHFSQILKQEGGDNQPIRYLGRHIVIGTVVDVRKGDKVPHGIEPVVDMRDDLSPLVAEPAPHNLHDHMDEEGGI